MWNRQGLFLYTNSDENSNYGLNLTCSERDINCARKKAAQTLHLLDKSYSTLLKTDAHPLRKLTLHHPVPSRQSDSCRSEAAERRLGNLEFQNSTLVSIFPGNISTSLFFDLSFPPCLIGQRSFRNSLFSAALISKSQVETCPAEGLLDSLSHSSLTHKQLVTHAASFVHLPDTPFCINAT